jgi:hypothetical protein
MKRQSTIAALAVCAFVAMTAPAYAASGVVRGTVQFFQNQGNFCPILSQQSRNCTGSRYSEMQFHVNRGLRHVRVYVKNQKNGSIIGQGTSNSEGGFTVSWSSKAEVAQASIFWEPEHKDGRFRVLTMGGAAYQHPGWQQQALTSGTTMAAPQQLGNRVWGSLSNPYNIANVADGALRMWSALSSSALMITGFNAVKIHTFTDPAGNDCPNSCAQGKSYIKLDANAAYTPQARVAHEMGHIAAYIANSYTPISDYCWSFSTAEWRSDSFTEGLATFLGDASMWSDASADPRTCKSQGFCTANPIEASSGAACSTSSTNPEFRHPLSVARFLWDVYDSVVDTSTICTGGGCVTRTDQLTRSVADILDVFHAYPSCFGDHCDDEPWDSNIFGNWHVDNRDGRSAEDFEFNFQKKFGTSAMDAWQMNCKP